MPFADLARAMPSRIAASRDAFLDGLTPRLSRSAIVAVCLVCVLGFLLLSATIPHGLLNGDAASYAQQIRALDIGGRTVHIGYYILGIVFTRLVPLDADFALNLLSAVLGALSAGLVFSIAYTLSGRLVAGLAASAVLLTNVVFVYNASFSEVYVPQLFFFLLAVQMVLWKRSIAAGLAFACAFLVTPSVVLAAPFLVLLRLKKKSLAYSAIASVLLVAGVLIPNIHDFLWGGRGLLAAVGAGMDPISALSKEADELKAFLPFALFAIAGLVAIVGSLRYRLFALGLALLWLFQFMPGEKFGDVPVQLPLYAMLAVVAGIGADALLRHPRLPRPVLVGVVTFFVLGSVVAHDVSFSKSALQALRVDSFRTAVLAMPGRTDKGFVAVGGWSRCILLEHYLYGKTYTGIWIDKQWLDVEAGEREKAQSWAQLRDVLSQGRQVWLLEPPTDGYLKMFKGRGYSVTPFQGGVYVADRAG